MKILILKPSSLGDVVQAIPVLRLLKKHLPESRIHWWISAELSALLEGDPDLDGIFLFERNRWRHPLHWAQHLRVIREMRAEQFDLVIDLQGLARSGLFGWLARGKMLIGLDDPREGAPGFYDIRVARPSRNAHAVDWYLSVLPPLIGPVTWDFQWLPPRPAALRAVQNRWDTSGGWIAICPGARWLNKRWLIENFQTLIQFIRRDFPGMRFVILGSREDAPLGSLLQKSDSDSILDLTGRTSIPELIEWIRLSDILITNDTGPMHIGAALGTRVLSIFGPTDPRRTGPYHQVQSAVATNIPCSPCFSASCHNPQVMACLRLISPALVYERAKAWIETISKPNQGTT